jgi:hypothetical protein
MSMCGLCGQTGVGDYEAHEKTERHELAGPRLVLAVAAGGDCPFCEPVGAEPRARLVRLRQCRVAEHKRALAERRAFFGTRRA